MYQRITAEYWVLAMASAHEKPEDREEEMGVDSPRSLGESADVSRTDEVNPDSNEQKTHDKASF